MDKVFISGQTVKTSDFGKTLQNEHEVGLGIHLKMTALFFLSESASTDLKTQSAGELPSPAQKESRPPHGSRDLLSSL